MDYRRPPALVAAELATYVERYGHSVRAMDAAVAATPAPEGLIDLTHGDTRAFVPPASAREDLLVAIEENAETYSPYRGSARVRDLLAPRVGALLGRDVDGSNEMVLTPGTQGGLFTALSALAGPGEMVALPALEYFMDERIGAYLGARLVRLDFDYGDDGKINVSDADLKAASRAGVRGLVLSHPNNPTGATYERADLERLADWAVTNDLWVVLDQLYCRLVFDGRAFTHLGSLPGMKERTVTLLGPSKTESMSGYRVGLAVGPAPVIDAMEQVISMTSLRTAGYTQHALRHWMDDDEAWIEERTRLHEELRDELVDSLRAIPGVRVSIPTGSSYVFPDASATPWGRDHDADDFELAKTLKSAGVLVSPGYQFGLSGRGHFRINFSQDRERLVRAVAIMHAVLEN